VDWAGAVTPASVTHVHLLAVINSELSRWPAGAPVRILDVGCGDGRLLAYLVTELARLRPGIAVEAYGFDVGDHGVQARGFLERTILLLKAQCPGYPWDERIVSIADGEAWPYANESFHFVISNQVLEHVRDHAFLMREVRRTLLDRGISVHLFPLRHYLLEGHLQLPLVHRIRNTDLMRAYITACSRAGLGKFRTHQRTFGSTLEEFSSRHADYMHYFTNYLSQTEVMRLAKRERLRVSFRYTFGFYTNKCRMLVGLPAMLTYSRDRSAGLDWIAVALLRYVSSVTLFLEKDETYTRGSGSNGGPL
jgi:SAM-dependent methyltransferase